VAVIGCQEEPIETHRVQLLEPPPPPEAKVRLLGAMIPHEKDTWFFKLVGKLEAIEPLQQPFEEFVRSVSFNKPGERIGWTLPKDWERLPNDNPSRYATIHVGPKDAGLDLTVVPLGDEPQTRSTFANVARWGRNDVGLKVRQDDVDNYVHLDKTAEGEPITFVDMKGPGGSGGGMKPPIAGGRNPHAPQEKLTYTAPPGWKETDKVVKRGGIEVRYEVALKVEEGGASALLTVSQFPVGAGDVLQNLNRWRDQVGLKPLERDQLADASREVRVDGKRALGVDFKGDERRILGVVVLRQDAVWFIKMDGPANLVGKQKAAFDNFVGSVKFDGGNGG